MVLNLLPKIWVRVRAALDNDSRNYIKLYQYEQLCETNTKLFADEFYRTLALRYPVDTAIQSTRNAISQDVRIG